MTLFLLLVLGSGPEADSAPVPERPPAAFTSLRHPETTDTAGPYRVTVHQLAGPEMAAGRLVFEVREGSGERRGGAPLRRAAGGGWQGEIPGQPAGSTITYHFVFSEGGGKEHRHPARSGTGYRFPVVTVSPLSVTLPPADGDRFAGSGVMLRVRAAGAVRGEMAFRTIGPAPGAARWERRALAPAGEASAEDGPGVHRLVADLPELAPGEAADFYFVLEAGGERETLPAGAPAQTYTLKRPFRTVARLPAPSGGFVLAVARTGEKRWAGLRGAGLIAWEGGGSTLRPQTRGSFAAGLPGGTVRFVLPDPPAGQLYLGGSRGVAALDLAGGSWRSLTTDPAGPPARTALRAGPAALSSLDGTLLFQVEEERERGRGAAVLEVRYGKPSPFTIALASGRLLGLTSAAFDPHDGSWLLGAVVEIAGVGPRPAALIGEAGSPALVPLGDFDHDGRRATPRRITALALDPSTGDTVAALEFLVEDPESPRRKTARGVFRLDAKGELRPIAAPLRALDVEVTSLATDWRRRAIFAGTFGLGLFRVRDGAALPVDLGPGASREITALELDAATGDLLLGTPNGALELLADGRVARPVADGDADNVPLDALPLDVDPRSGRVLLSSYSSGLAEMVKGSEGWRVARRIRQGEDFPRGAPGDARYLPGGGIAAIVHGKGLVLLREGGPILLGPEAGVRATDLLRVLPRASGEIWLAHAGLPFGSGAGAFLQVIRDGRVERTTEIRDRDLASIGAWIEWPERRAILAATRAGAALIGEDGAFALLSREPVSSIAREPGSGALGLAGAALERWDGERFRPVLFRVDHPRWPPGRFPAGSPVDLALDSRGSWSIATSGGALAFLDAEGNCLGLLDQEDGLPAAIQKLLLHPGTGELLAGSAGEGMAAIGMREET